MNQVTNVQDKPQLVFAANVLRYSCGCALEWQFIGIFAHIPEYHIIPCYKHAEQREEMEQVAAEDWEKLMNGVRK